MKPSYEAAEMIEDAADLIEKKGWFRGRIYWDAPLHEEIPGETFCAGTAVQNQADAAPYRWGLPELVRRALDLPLTPEGVGDFCALAYWNNHPDRTKQDVLDGLRLAAKRVRIQADALS